MNLLDLVETWAKGKGWWTSKTEPSEDGYLYIAKRDPFKDVIRPRIFTLWADAKWDIDGFYPDDPDQKLEPADPDFFLNLEYLIITKSK